MLHMLRTYPKATPSGQIRRPKPAGSGRSPCSPSGPGIHYAVVVDNPDADPERLMLAIRRAMPDGSTVTAELAISRAKYDAARLLDLIARDGGAVH
jgi:hypothetical protein